MAQSAVYTYDQVGDTYYFIGKGENVSQLMQRLSEIQINDQ